MATSGPPSRVAGFSYTYNYFSLAYGPSGWVAVGALAESISGSLVAGRNDPQSRDGKDWLSPDNGPTEWIAYPDKLAVAGGWFCPRRRLPPGCCFWAGAGFASLPRRGHVIESDGVTGSRCVTWGCHG